MAVVLVSALAVASSPVVFRSRATILSQARRSLCISSFVPERGFSAEFIARARLWILHGFKAVDTSWCSKYLATALGLNEWLSKKHLRS